MQQRSGQDERLARYLLGDLPEAEQMALEQEYFADPEKLEEVWAAENELVDRYVRGRLSRAELVLFGQHYLQSPKHRQRVAVARNLLEAADGRITKNDEEQQPISWLEILLAWLTPRRLATGAASLLLLAALAWLAIERVRLNRELGSVQTQLSAQQRREHEIAGQLAAERDQSGRWRSELERALEKLSQRPAHSPPSVLTFLLTQGLSARGQGETQQIMIPREADLIRFQMKPDELDSISYEATIVIVGGPQILKQRSLKATAGTITVAIPASKLPAEDYFLILSASTGAGQTREIDTYVLRVTR